MRCTVICLLLLMIPVVIGIEDAQYESYAVNENALLKIRVFNATDVILDANCTIDIYDNQNVLVVDDGEMTYGGRRYSYAYTFNESGEWFVEYFCFNNATDETTIYGKDISIQDIELDDISVDISNISTAAEVWAYENRTLTNASDIAGDIWGANETIHPNILSQIVYGVWNYIARYIHGEII